MMLGAYAVTLEGVPSMLLNFLDSLRVRRHGIPRVQGDSPEEIAKEVLRRNARKILYAGSGHFHFMWVSDFAKALRGSLRALPHPYLKKTIAYMVAESGRLGRVTSCFTTRHGFDMPYYRGDNLPWLVHALREYSALTGDLSLTESSRPALERLLDGYEREFLSGGLIPPRMTGDWADTILRPSSTYNNLCALRMLRILPELGIASRTDPAAFERAILESRWRGDHFTDYKGTERLSVDAAVFALYFDLFTPEIRGAAARRIRKEGLDLPFPIRNTPAPYGKELQPLISRLSPTYHSCYWLHLGLVWLNGLKRRGENISEARGKVEHLVQKYGNFLETLDENGLPYRTFFHSTEYGLSMAAGQYLELIDK